MTGAVMAGLVPAIHAGRLKIVAGKASRPLAVLDAPSVEMKTRYGGCDLLVSGRSPGFPARRRVYGRHKAGHDVADERGASPIG